MKKITTADIGCACVLPILKAYKWTGGEPLTVVILGITRDKRAIVCENGAPENQYVVHPRFLKVINL